MVDRNSQFSAEYDPTRKIADCHSTPEEEFEHLVAKVSSYMGSDNIAIIEQAYHFAAAAHADQKRKSGELYITHPLAVASILADLNLDLSSIIAAVLHDTVEDTEVTVAEVRDKFGDQVAEIVDGLTKIGKVKFRSNQERMAENFRKMIVAMAKDLRVILIKLADRLHNMRTIQCMPSAKAKRIAQETLDIYAPLASRLGIYGIKSELEDICLRVLKPEIYQQIRQKIAAKKERRQAYIDEVITILENELKRYHFENVEVYGRPKHFYSIYKKMLDRRLEFEDIHDLFAFRIVVDSIKDCYEALGIVHAMWKPMPGRFKDYIAMPKANMYQSLHTTVIRPNGEPAEIQIRTQEMHRVCEFGVAAHWTYKEKNQGQITGADAEKFSWLRQIVQWQSELQDPNEFLEAVKVDLFDEEIFVFTPRGDVISLPRNATALDFAFAVHTDIGSKTIGAKINSSIAPIKRVLRSGDIVEVLTSPHQKPSKDWLNFVITSKAKNKIRSALRKEQRDQSRKFGHDMLEAELERIGSSVSRIKKTGDDQRLVKHARESSLDDVLISLGYGRLDPRELIAKAFPTESKSEKQKEEEHRQAIESIKSKQQSRTQKSAHGILVSGINNVLVNLAKCCNPLPGEAIIGFITRGRGVTVHRSSCSKALDLDPHRRIEVSWSKESQPSLHSAYIRVTTRDKIGVLAEVTQAITSCGCNVNQADIRVNQDMIGVLDFELGLKDLPQLEAVIRKLENIPAVVGVVRKSIMRVKSSNE